MRAQGGSEVAALLLCPAGPCPPAPAALPPGTACLRVDGTRLRPPFTVSLASLQLPALPTTFLFSVLRASALPLRPPPLPSGQVPPPPGLPAGPQPVPDGVRSGPWPGVAGVEGGEAGQAGGPLPAPRDAVRLGAALLTAVTSDTLTPMATPQLGGRCPSLLGESFASGSGKQPGGHLGGGGSRPGRDPSAAAGGAVGLGCRAVGSRLPLTAPPSTTRVGALPGRLCVFPPLSRSLSPVRGDSWVPS